MTLKGPKVQQPESFPAIHRVGQATTLVSWHPEAMSSDRFGARGSSTRQPLGPCSCRPTFRPGPNLCIDSSGGCWWGRSSRRFTTRPADDGVKVRTGAPDRSAAAPGAGKTRNTSYRRPGTQPWMTGTQLGPPRYTTCRFWAPQGPGRPGLCTKRVEVVYQGGEVVYRRPTGPWAPVR